MTTDRIRVAGLDGCPAGWLLVTATTARAPDGGRTAPAALGAVEIEVVATFAAALAPVLDGSVAAMGVDMPIGLPGAGLRQADRAARRRLGPRRSSVFPR